MRTDPGLSEALLALAHARGASLAEVYQKAGRTISADARDNARESLETSSSFGCSLRIVKEGKPGFSYSTQYPLNRAGMETMVEAALGSAKFAEPDEYIDFPEPRTPVTPEVLDPAVEAITEEQAVEKACLVEQASRGEDARITKIRKASASFTAVETLVANSRGLSYCYPATDLSAHVTAVAEEGGDSQMGWDFHAARFLSDLNFEEVGSRAARRALGLLGARRLDAVKSPVLLDGLVATEFLSVFASMLSSESVQKGKSLLRGKLGRKVVASLLTVVDDGLLERGLGTGHIDDEGVPASKKVLIQGGVLQGFLYNTRTARKDRVASTGNALRRGPLSPPSVGPTNLFLNTDGGALSPRELIHGLHRGLHVLEAMGIHTANPVSGDFSIGVSGFWVEGGEHVYPVKEAVISGNLLDFFDSTEAVGSDLRFYGTIGSPSILMGATDISA